MRIGSKKIVLLSLLIFGMLFFFCGCENREDELQVLQELNEQGESSFKEASQEAPEEAPEEIAQETAQEEKFKEEESEPGEAFIYVHVCGAVNNPGVYRLLAGQRAYEAVALAGGFSEEAAEEYLNQAQALNDESKLYIPTRKEALEQNLPKSSEGAGTKETGTKEAAHDSKGVTSEETGKININTAARETLCTLPGIGDSKADSIIKYREEQGSFSKIEDIMKVGGIKSGLFNKIKEKITV